MSKCSQKPNSIRTEPAGQPGTDPFEEQANHLIDYYQNLFDVEGKDSWLLGLYMAKQWLRYLQEPQHDMAELKLFLRALETERPNQGSGWGDLWSRVSIWIAKIEQHEHV